MCIPDPEFPIGSQLCIENMEKPQFIDAPDCQVVARWMKGKRDEGSVRLKIFFYFEIKHPQQFAAEVFVVPYANGAILLAASGHKGSLFTEIHACDGMVVKALIEILEYDFFVGEVVE